jgi:predicted HAD superfamily hydrolase
VWIISIAKIKKKNLEVTNQIFLFSVPRDGFYLQLINDLIYDGMMIKVRLLIGSIPSKKTTCVCKRERKQKLAWLQIFSNARYLINLVSVNLVESILIILLA